jgi:hypothetical protein
VWESELEDHKCAREVSHTSTTSIWMYSWEHLEGVNRSSCEINSKQHKLGLYKVLVRTKTKLGWEERRKENSLLDYSFKMSIKLRSNIASERELKKTVIAISKVDTRHNDFYRGSAKSYSTLWWPPLVKGCNQCLNPSQVIQISNLSATFVFLISISRCEESPQIGAPHALHKLLQ